GGLPYRAMRGRKKKPPQTPPEYSTGGAFPRQFLPKSVATPPLMDEPLRTCNSKLETRNYWVMAVRSDAEHDLGILIEVACRLSETFELAPLLHTIEAAGRSALGCERATIFLYDKNCDELYSTVATGSDEIRLPARMGIAGE